MKLVYLGSVNAARSCSNTELGIAGNSNKLVYSTQLHAALSLITFRFSLHSYRRNSPSHTSTPGVSSNLSKELNSIDEIYNTLEGLGHC